MSHYPEPESLIRDKIKVVLDLLNYDTKKEILNVATDVDRSNLAAKKNFIALKVQVKKLDLNKLVNVPTGLNKRKTRVDHLGVDKLKTVPVDLKKSSDVVSEEYLKQIV